MCLKKLKNTEPIIAEEDIVCYKFVCNTEFLSTAKLQKLHGEKFSATIHGHDCTGRISIHSNEIFYCTDNFKIHGRSCPNRFGYHYSWTHDGYVSNVKIGEKNKPLIFSKIYETPYQEARIKIGKTYNSMLNVRYNYGETEVYIGLHSFAHFHDCVEHAKSFMNSVIVKCIISKGSKYYEGKFSNYVSYASNKITYVEIINNL